MPNECRHTIQCVETEFFPMHIHCAHKNGLMLSVMIPGLKIIYYVFFMRLFHFSRLKKTLVIHASVYQAFSTECTCTCVLICLTSCIPYHMFHSISYDHTVLDYVPVLLVCADGSNAATYRHVYSLHISQSVTGSFDTV